MQMSELLKASESAYANGNGWAGKLSRPLPILLAILTVPNLVVAGAPPSFDELALMQFVVEDKDVIQRKPISNQDGMEAFTQQLFGFLAISTEPACASAVMPAAAFDRSFFCPAEL